MLYGASPPRRMRGFCREKVCGENSTGSSAEVHVTLGISVGALCPQPQRKDASIYLQSGELGSPLALNCPLEVPPANGDQPRSVLQLQHGQDVARPRLCPLGRSSLKVVFHPSSFGARQSSTHGTWAVQLTRCTEQILKVSTNVCWVPALQPGVGLTKPGHPSTTAQLRPTCVTTTCMLPAPINEASF